MIEIDFPAASTTSHVIDTADSGKYRGHFPNLLLRSSKDKQAILFSKHHYLCPINVQDVNFSHDGLADHPI
jgi:hypothetical protein